jgi:hypothetical protein
LKNDNMVLKKVDEINERLSDIPIVKGLFEGGLSLLPGIGTVITTTLNTRLSKLQEKNSNVFIKEVREQLDSINKDKIDKTFIESDEFVSLLTDILVRNAQGHEEEKVKIYATVFVNALLSENAEVPYKEGFIQIIDALSLAHIRALSFLYNKEQTFTEKDRENNQDYVAAKDIAEFIGEQEYRVVAYCQQMIRFGLVYDWSLGRATGPQANMFAITTYGQEFAKFLIRQTG